MDLQSLTQPPALYVIIAVAVVLVALVIAAVVMRKRRRRDREELRDRYGSEYERTVRRHGDTKAAVADLKERERLHDEVELHDLNDADAELVRHHMATAQYRFAEDPDDALLHTQRVLTEVLRAKGYPVGEDREQALRVLSVDHPEAAERVRTVIDGRHGSDSEAKRRAFLDAREALRTIAGISYVLEDATDTREDLRVERSDRERTAADGRRPRP